jgi:hypothetical protein
LKKQSEGATASCGRLVFDYRKLNEIVKPMHYPLMKIDNLFEKCSKFKLFSLIDIKNAFLSVALTERAKKMVGVYYSIRGIPPSKDPFWIKNVAERFLLCHATRLKGPGRFHRRLHGRYNRFGHGRGEYDRKVNQTF